MLIKAKLADKSKPILSLGKNFNLQPSGIEKIDVPLGTEQSNIIACFVKGDKTNDQAGAGWTVYRENILLKEESLRLGRRNTALQAELIDVDRMAQYLLKDKYETDKILIYTDNQTVLQALDRLMIKTKVCASTFNSLHRLGEKINVTLYWIQAGTKPYGLRRAIELSGEGAGVRHGLRSRFPYPVGKLIFRKFQERVHTSGGQITLKDMSRRHSVTSSSKNGYMLTGIGFA